MTKKTENGVQDTPENSSLPVDSLAAAFAAGMKQALEQVAPKPAFDYAEYIQRPENIDPATTLKRPVLQHGHPINIWGIKKDDAIINHLNELEPGEYLGGRVKVILMGREPNQKLNVTYPWDTVQERMKNQTLFSSFSDLLQKINNEQKQKAASKDN